VARAVKASSDDLFLNGFTMSSAQCEAGPGSDSYTCAGDIDCRVTQGVELDAGGWRPEGGTTFFYCTRTTGNGGGWVSSCVLQDEAGMYVRSEPLEDVYPWCPFETEEESGVVPSDVSMDHPPSSE
jgi:hypothetical protein